MDMTYDGGRLAAWDDELEELYQRLSGRGEFRWDASSDGLYLAARDRAVQGGRLAMRDTMGRAAALTGGYGSSYALAASQREYDDYLTRLGEAMPQYYGMARQSWEAGGEALKDRYELLYRRSEDEKARQAAEHRAAEQAREAELKRRAEADKEAARQRQSGYNALVKLIQSSGYRPSDAELDDTGLTRAAADALYEAWAAKQKKSRRRSSTKKKKDGDAAAGADADGGVQTSSVSGGGGARPNLVAAR